MSIFVPMDFGKESLDIFAIAKIANKRMGFDFFKPLDFGKFPLNGCQASRRANAMLREALARGDDD